MLYLLVINIFSFLTIPIVSLHGANAVLFNDSSNPMRHGSCRMRSIRQAVDPPSGRSMTESFVLDDVEYKLCRYHVTWDEALVFCSTHKAHLATLDNEKKAAFVMQAMASSTFVFEDYWIGARKYYDDLWTWNSSAKKLSEETEIIGNIPVWYPGDESNDFHCLTIDRNGHDSPIFVPRGCNQRRGFICQRDNERTHDNKIRMVAASRIGDQEFRLYSGRTTWAEAVVQCRQEGLQIGEVNTVEEARALAISMLRNRPEGIESAWIGGYTGMHDPGIWHWLASGEKIENNEMWRNNLSESSGDCLLLDRHLCETPVYVQATCDRKRDVLCQKPPKKPPSKTPAQAIVEGCPYWIGFYPLKWSEARQSCESVNASLVVLDSPRTIAHMMSLMQDNRAGLRHIWTDGRRTRKYRRWQWEVNGETIPNYVGTFIPWCPEDNINSNGTDCLNLDREGFHSPLVYGLSCNERQPYICQPRIGDCVSRSNKSTKYNEEKMMNSASTKLTTAVSLPLFFHENTETLQHSKVTGTYPIVTDNYATISTSMDDNRSIKYYYHDDDIDHWEPGESISSENVTSGNHFAQYLTPLTSFTLPSFPQFGIKTVSAHEMTTNTLPNYEIKKTNRMKQFSATPSPVMKSTISPSMFTSSTIPNTFKNNPVGLRKAFRVPQKSSNYSSVTPYHGGYDESTTITNFSRKQFSTSHLKSMTKVISSDLNKLNFTKIRKMSITPDDPFSSSNLQSGRTKKYSVKTTRDLMNSNVTKIVSIATTKNPDLSISMYDEKIPTTLIPSTSVIRQVQTFNEETKSHADKFSPNSLKLITTPLPRKGLKYHFTTEKTTPYDAIDEDYYDDDETRDFKIKKEKKINEDENYDESNTDIDEYDEDYDGENDAKIPSKKRIKQTSTSNIGKSYTTVKSSERRKLSKENKIEKNRKPSIPIAHELSENLQMALVKMLKTGMEKKKNESNGNLGIKTKAMEETKSIPSESISGIKNNNTKEIAAKSKPNANDLSLHPYYAFEGPMIVGFSEESNLPANAERITENGKFRQIEFTGKKVMDGPVNFPSNDKPNKPRINEKETRRSNIRGPIENKNVPNIIPPLMSGLPAIRPDDPNSMLQMGRYFKNRFGNLVSTNGGQTSENIRRDEYERYLKNERNEPPRWSPRLRGQNTGFRGQTSSKNRQRYSLSRDDDSHGNRQRSEDATYYETARRLYPRGDYDITNTHVPSEGVQQNIDGSWREQHERLSVSWPKINLTNSKISNIDESQVVSPRNFPAPMRTTRSFNDDSESLKVDHSKNAPLPDFKISKLIKEVKIDLDQRLLRNYLESLAKKIFQKENSSYEKNDWKDTWRYLLEQMSRVLDRVNINVNGDVMKVRVGSDNVNKMRKLDNFRKIEWKSGLRKQRKDFGSFRIFKNLTRQKLKKIKDTSMEQNSSYKPVKLMENRQVSPNSLVRQSSEKINTKVHQMTNNYKIDSAENDVSKNTDKISLERENTTKPLGNDASPKYLQIQNQSRYHGQMLGKTRNFYFHNDERASMQPINRNMHFDRFENNKKLGNWYQPNYMNNINNNSRIIVAPAIIRSAGIYAYPPITPQLHHRIIFQPGLNQFRPIGRINSVSDKSSILNGEYLPKGTLSRIIGSEHTNQHFSQESISPSQFSPQPTGNSSRTNQNYFNDREMNDEKLKVTKIDNSTVEILKKFDNRDEMEGKNEEWQNNYEERNKLENGDYYANETNVNRFDDEFEKIADEGINSDQDYPPKPILSSAHRLGKALELSHFNKFRQTPMNYSPMRNIVTRSLKNNEISEKFNTHRRKGRGSNNDRGRAAIVKNLESLKDEPSIVSLRMIMKPEKNVARISRQSINSSDIGKSPQTVELHMRFSGKQKKVHSEDEKMYSDFSREGRKNVVNFSNIGNQTFNGANKSNEKFDTRKIPIRFMDKIRRRTMFNKLRERIKLGMKNYPFSYTVKGVNGTTIVNPRDRKSRTVVTEKNGKNSIEERMSKKYSGARHYLATSSTSFEDKNITKNNHSYGKEFGIDWSRNIASLFTDLRENNDQLTVYVNLTFGRGGTKSQRNGQKSRT